MRPKSDENFNISEFLKSLLPGQSSDSSSNQMTKLPFISTDPAESVPFISNYNPQRELLEYNLPPSNINVPQEPLDYNNTSLGPDLIQDYNSQQIVGSLTNDRKSDSDLDYSGLYIHTFL